MKRKSILALMVALYTSPAGLLMWLWMTTASANVACSLPFNLQNGTTADATQVMANYNALVTCLGNAAAAGANTDITALLGLTTPLAPSEGGSSVFIAATSTNISNAYSITTTIPSTGFALTQGYIASFIPSATNTGAATLAVNGLTATAIERATLSGLQPLVGNEIHIGQGVLAYYDGTEFVLLTNANPPISTTFLQNYLAGMELSAAGSTGTFGVTAGEASDSTNVSSMLLASAYTKTTASWTVGSGNGGLDTGAIANTTWYHVFIIQRLDTGVVDVLFSLSPSSPTLPTNYTLFRRVGSMRTDSSAHWVAFVQNGSEFIWATQFADGSNPSVVTSTASLITLTVPTGVKVNALFRSTLGSTSAGVVVIYTSPDETDQAPGNIADLFTANAASSFTSGRFNVRTNTSAQIRARSGALGGVNCYFGTYGWTDLRGQT